MKDSRLVISLLMITVGLAVLIFAVSGYDTESRRFYFSDPASGANTNSASTIREETRAISPGTAFAEKCARSGVVKCFGFDDAANLYYNWPPGTTCDDAFAGHTNYRFGTSRRGRGNTVAVVQNGQCVFPQIDTGTFHSGTGSLRITIPSKSYADSGGHFTEVFKRTGDGNPDGTYIGPGSHYGNILYFQFYERFDENFLSTNFQCAGGDCGGWKQSIWYGNPPNGRSASNLEVTMNNGWQRGVPQMYGQAGSDYYGIQDVRGCAYNRGVTRAGSGFEPHVNYPEPLCIRYKADRWMEFTGRIEVLGRSNEPASRAQLWVDGELVIDYNRAKIDWSGTSGEGFGQFLLSPYHTNKDAAQAHPVGHVWYDDLLISTRPIAMRGNNASAPNPSPALQ